MKSDPLVGNKCPQGQKAESLGEEVQVCSESEIPVIKEQLEGPALCGPDGELSEDALDNVSGGCLL